MAVNKSDQEYTHVRQLLKKMDPDIAASFSYKQRKALQKAMDTRSWNNHKIDFRPTLALPFLPWSFYFVFLGGVNRRKLSSSERVTAAIVFFNHATCLQCYFAWDLVCCALLIKVLARY